MKVKTFKETVKSYLLFLLIIAATIFSIFVIDDMQNWEHIILGSVLLGPIWLIIILINIEAAIDEYNHQFVSFKIVEYQKWGKNTEKYITFYQIYPTSKYDVSIYQWHWKTYISSPTINEKIILRQHEDNYAFPSKETAMKSILYKVKEKIKSNKNIENVKIKNIKEIETITFDEAVELLNK
jgi:hypothetical protein